MSYRKKKRSPNGRAQIDPQQTSLTGMNADTQSTEELLSTSILFSGQPYQQPVKDHVVDKLVREWDPRLLTPLVVSYQDGKYNLVDGQHRVCAMRKKNGGKDVTALCRVYRGMTYEEEAELYYKLDRSKGHLRLPNATKALVESGSNAEVIEIKRLLEDAGFIWALDKPTREPFEIEATRAVISAYRMLGGAAFSRMLRLLAKTWYGTPTSLNASILSGMALFLKTYETEVDDEAFIAQLSAVEPEEIIRLGKMDYSTNKASLRYARVIWSKYNCQRRGKRKLPYRFNG